MVLVVVPLLPLLLVMVLVLPLLGVGCWVLDAAGAAAVLQLDHRCLSSDCFSLTGR
jgi:hypothetical protein